MKKLISSVLAAAAASALLGAAPVSAAESVFRVSAVPDTNPNTAPVQIDTGIAGMTLTVGADTWTYKADSQSDIHGTVYTGRIYGTNSPKTAEGTGTYYSFAFDETIENGILTVMYQIGENKQLTVLENGTAMDGYSRETTEKITTSADINVKGGNTYTVYASGSKLSFYGCTYKEVDPEADFAAEIAAFPFSAIAGENESQDKIEYDLELIQSYESQFGSCDVSWETSDSSVIDNDGTVNAKASETKVTLTGRFSVQENDSLTAQKSFELTVPADLDDASAAAAAAESLTLGDVSSVKKDLQLPSLGKRGTSIEWSSEDESIVTNAGVITRYPGIDKTVILTAYISRGNVIVTKPFTVTVAGYVPITLNGCSYVSSLDSPRCTPSDGGRLKSITVTSGIKEPSGNDTMFAAVYKSDGTLKGVRTIKLSALPYEIDKSVDINLPMDSTDKFKLISMDSDRLTPYGNTLQSNEKLAEDAKIYVVGDSTASIYDAKNYPRKGWAQMLGNYFDGIEVVDYALSGRSSVSFKNEANYTKLKNEIKKGDCLIIQFGHNDAKADDSTRYSDPETDRFTDGSYKKSMYEYIDLARDKGAMPVIATSISRRKASDASMEKYVKAAKELAAEVDVPCIDLYAMTNGYINEVGVENAKDMFNYVKPHDSRFIDFPDFINSGFYENGTSDDTHINIYGADLIAQWAADALKEMGHPTAQKMSDYRAVFPLPSYEQAESK